MCEWNHLFNKFMIICSMKSSKEKSFQGNCELASVLQSHHYILIVFSAVNWFFWQWNSDEMFIIYQLFDIEPNLFRGIMSDQNAKNVDKCQDFVPGSLILSFSWDNVSFYLIILELFLKIGQLIVLITYSNIHNFFFSSSRMARLRERLGSRSCEYFCNFSYKQDHVSSTSPWCFHNQRNKNVKRRRSHLFISRNIASIVTKIH